MILSATTFSFRFRFPLIAGTVLALSLSVSGAAAPEKQNWRDLAGVIAPSAGEQAWLAIPWETDLQSARQKAVAQNKPIFLWEMDGHPLGCT